METTYGVFDEQSGNALDFDTNIDAIRDRWRHYIKDGDWSVIVFNPEGRAVDTILPTELVKG